MLRMDPHDERLYETPEVTYDTPGGIYETLEVSSEIYENQSAGVYDLTCEVPGEYDTRLPPPPALPPPPPPLPPFGEMRSRTSSSSSSSSSSHAQQEDIEEKEEVEEEVKEEEEEERSSPVDKGNSSRRSSSSSSSSSASEKETQTVVNPEPEDKDDSVGLFVKVILIMRLIIIMKNIFIYQSIVNDFAYSVCKVCMLSLHKRKPVTSIGLIKLSHKYIHTVHNVFVHVIVEHPKSELCPIVVDPPNT